MRGSVWSNIIYKMWFYWKVFTGFCFLGLAVILITISSWTDTLVRIVARLVCKNEALQYLVPEVINGISVALAEHGHKAQNPLNRP